MNLLKVAGCAVLCLYSFVASSQDAAVTVTDDELKKYAIAMDSVDNMKAELQKTMAELVKSSTKINGARYNVLSKIINDEAKLAEAKATPEEIEGVKEVLAKKDEGTAKIQQAVQSLAKDFVGAAVYNKVKKALADPAVKARYDAILAEINKSDS